MRTRLLLLPLVFLSSSCSAPPSRQQVLMEEIERKVSLPSEAFSLSRYARHYAYTDKGIEAVYVAIYPPYLEGDLGFITEGGGWRPMSEAEERESEAAAAADRIRKGDAGKRYWHAADNEFPYADDGGCDYVNVGYDAAAKQFLYVACNGPVGRGRPD